MARVLILGAGVAGHTAALHLRRLLDKEHTVTVVTPNSKWNWIPSNIWVGVGRMSKKDVVFPLAPVYKRKGIEYVQAKAVAIRPNGDADDPTGARRRGLHGPGAQRPEARLRFDYLINATGPKPPLRGHAGSRPARGPHGLGVHRGPRHRGGREVRPVSRAGEGGGAPTVVVGMGHGTATCQGAAFEYTFNVEHELREAGVRDNTEVIYLTNEAELGDFGMGGMTFQQRGFHAEFAAVDGVPLQ
jgi:sulfide:quinone oxidoreductase